MDERLGRFREYLTKYSLRYRAKHGLPPDAFIQVIFQGNDTDLVFQVRPIEPLVMKEGYFWFNDNSSDLRLCTTANQQDSGFNHVYEVINTYAQAFHTTVQLKSESIDVNADYSSVQKDETTKGEMIVSDGYNDRRIPAGDLSQVLISDPSTDLGVRWTDNVAGIRWRDDWDETVEYEKDDIVRHMRQMYITKKRHTGLEPSPDNVEFWTLFILGGDLYVRGQVFLVLAVEPLVETKITEVIVPSRGYITKVGVKASEARTAGHLRFRVIRNGVPLPVTDLDVYLDGSNPMQASAEIPTGTVEYQVPEGDTIGLIVTSSDFEPDTNAVEVYLLFQYG